MTCHMCGERWAEHVQGRCPAQVAANFEAFAAFMKLAISVLTIIGVLSYICGRLS